VPPRRQSEQGFVLIKAVWLLLLCAAIVAVLMLRCNTASTTATDELLKQQLALDAATETVIAGLLLRGSISQWAAARKRLAALT
jgi:Tfp pilus assembly protein PilX